MAKESTTTEAPAIGPATQATFPDSSGDKTAPVEFKRAPSGMPVWDEPLTDPRRRFKVAQRQFRAGVAQAKIEELEAGPNKYRVALVGKKDGHPLKVLHLGLPVDSLIVGGHNPDEARGKFARHNGMHGGQEFIKVEPVGA